MLVDGYLESRADNPMTAMITGFNTTGREQSINSFRAMVQSINLPIVIAWDNDKQKVYGTCWYSSFYDYECILITQTILVKMGYN